MRDPVAAMAAQAKLAAGAEPAQATDYQLVREALAKVTSRLTDREIEHVHAILARRDLTRRDAYDVRVALLGLYASHDRLMKQLTAFRPAPQGSLFGRAS